MTHKQQFSNLALPQKGVIFSRILLLGVAAAATSVVTMVAPRPVRAQQVTSPVSVTVVNPTSPGTPSIGGTAVSETTTTETTTTTTGETTTTVTETTTTTTTTTETEVGVEATTNVVDDTATTAVPPEAVELEVVQEAAPQNTGEIMTTATDTSIPAAAPTQETPTPQPPPAAEAPQQAPQQQAAVTNTVVEQFIFGTTIETLYLRGLAGRLGTSESILLQTRVFTVVRGLSGNQTALLQAFQAALERAGILNLAAYNNAGFADLIANSGNAELAMQIFSRLAANRLLLVARLGGLSSLSVRRGLVGVRFARITVTQYVVYQGLGVRFPGFPEERKK